MKIIVYSSHEYEIPFLKQAFAGTFDVIFCRELLNNESAHLAEGCSVASIFTSDDCSANVLEKLFAAGIRYLALRSVGFDHVDLEKAKSLGIIVANVPEYSPYSVAEHAVALLLAWNRKIVQSQQLMQLHDFRIDTLAGFDVHGKKIGVIGMGKIGLAFSKILKGFGADVFAFDIKQNEDALALGIKYIPLDELLKQSDVISVHCPLTTSTRYLLGRKQFLLVKRNCVIINTSRGAVINSLELVEALEEGLLSGACLDVYEYEKTIYSTDQRLNVLRDSIFARLMNLKNVLMTSHQGFLTREALLGIATTTVHSIACWEEGENSPTELTVSKNVPDPTMI